MKYYAGIGPRTTPANVQGVMMDIARQLVPTGWCLRSGHAHGADQAFERGAANRQIFLPWDGFNGAHPNGKDMFLLPLSDKMISIAANNHPRWDACTPGAQKLLARNVPIILGTNLDDPVSCVITWLPVPSYQGGTTHALRIASTYGVPVFDIHQREDQIAMTKFILNLENREPRVIAA